jgi:hypothetical protein
VYVRQGERLKVLYVALRPVYILDAGAPCSLLLFVVESLIGIGRRVKDVKFVEFCVGSRDAVFKVH